MKKVINGKIYNTETAEAVAAWGNGLSRNDFGWCEEVLYVTAKGTYFVAGKGGASSRWAESLGGSNNGRCEGSGMEVLSKAEALEWCERHAIAADTVAALFDIEEG